jgi:hypothetical protein
MSAELDETTEEQLYDVHFLLKKGLGAKDIHKDMFPVYGGKRFTT